MSTAEAPQSPKAVVHAALAAFDRRHWLEFAKLVDRAALTAFRDEHLRDVEAWERIPAPRERQHPSITPRVDEFFNKQKADARRAELERVLRPFARVKSVDELRSLTPAEFLARYYETLSPPLSSGPSPAVSLHRGADTQREIIGETFEGPELVHVVYRVHVVAYMDIHKPPWRYHDVRVVPVARGPEGWRIMLNEDLSLIGDHRVSSECHPGERACFDTFLSLPRPPGD